MTALISTIRRAAQDYARAHGQGATLAHTLAFAALAPLALFAAVLFVAATGGL